MKKKLTSLLMASALLTGCQSFISKPTKKDIMHSYAWNVNYVSNMDVFYDKKVSPNVKNIFDDYNYYWGFTSDNNPKNLSRMNLDPIIKYNYPVGMAAEEWAFNHILIWVPKEMATSKEQSRLVAEKILDKAIKKTWPDMQFNRMSEMNGGPLNTFTLGLAGNSSRISTYFIWDRDISCKTNRFTNQKKPNACLFYISFKGSTGLVNTPKFIGSGSSESYIIDPSFISIDITDNLKPNASEERDRRALIQKLSNNLPSWMFIYLAPNEKNSLPAVMIQSGKSYFYITENR
ncbi:hypothetical protein PMPD1_1996 [Paramixta manurensis]|uniref:Lipoprotein n=1 Tax=Paramixta manurensis TaxID=2740817 RepID=A0A6M8U8H0_9GAMM|nr:hypothetical protein PMPD1_1996 [Erwiniaceae bacterium PD-1]